jgi:hypothetical protein
MYASYLAPRITIGYSLYLILYNLGNAMNNQAFASYLKVFSASTNGGARVFSMRGQIINKYYII